MNIKSDHFGRLDATITILRQREVDYDLEEGEPPRKACELLVRRVPDDQQVS